MGPDGPTKVLIIDDEKFNIDIIKGMLYHEHIPCEAAMSGEQALEKIEQRIAEM